MVFIFLKNIKDYFAFKVLVVMLCIAVYGCKSAIIHDYKTPAFVDKNLSSNTKELHRKLYYITKKGFAVGHQDATAYGVNWNYKDHPSIVRSDVNDVVGDFPAVYGFEIGHLELGDSMSLDKVPFDRMRKLIIDAHNRGGIITISWHLDNPTSRGSSWDKTAAVQDILKGGKHREKYELWVSRIADFFSSLKVDDKLIPVIFRPFHEMNGSWFWWGQGNCTATDYIALWRDTVILLKGKHNVHNLLYAYSPNKLNPEDDYMKYYPGDNYLDILGVDIYDFKNSEDYIKSINHDLSIVRAVAKEKDKLYAFTETGLETLSTTNWFTEVLYPNIKDSGISWILFWRNARKEHHYMPYKGHTIEKDFMAFEKFPETLFLKDIQKIKY
ncbi:MAG TPA: glycosyl hydrolase [Flavobacteriaceae bacterium]|nr:glycosyl hydrolase [Flavobacteriaceae bacterium]